MKAIDYTVDCMGFLYAPDYKVYHDCISDALVEAGFGEPLVKAYKQSGTLLQFNFLEKTEHFPYRARVKVYNKLVQGLESENCFMTVGNGLKSIY